MNSLLSILFYIGIIVIVFISGIWISVLFIPNQFSKYKLIGSFLFGFMWLILFCTWMSYIGFSFNQSAFFILAFSIISSIIAIYIEIKRDNGSAWLDDSSTKWILLIGIASGILVLLPIVLFNALSPYCDGFTYVSIADYLLDHGYFVHANPNPYYPSISQMELYQDRGLRMGAQFFLAFMTAVFKRSFSIELFMPCLAAAQFFMVSAMWLFCRIGLKIRTNASIIAVIFVSINLGILFNNSIQGFFPQAYGIVIMLVIFSLFLNIEKWNDFIISSIVLTAIAIATLIITYSELLPIIVLSILFLLIYKTIMNQKDTLTFLKNTSIVVLLSILFSNVGFFKALDAIQTQIGSVNGWHIPYTLWEYILLIFALDPVWNSNMIFNRYPIIYFGVSLGALLGIYIIFNEFICKNKWLDIKLQLIVLGLPFLLLIIYFGFFVENPWLPGEIGQTWNVWKTVQYMYVLIPPIIGLSYYQFFNKNKIYRIIGKYVIVGLVITSIVFTGYFSYGMTETMRVFTGNTINPINEYYRLYEKLKDEKKPINLYLPADLAKHKELIAYFLQKHELVSDWRSDNYLQGMIPQRMRKDGITLVYNPNSRNKIANMEILGNNVYLNFVAGAYGMEKNEKQTWTWTSGKVDIMTINPTEDLKKVNLTFSIGLPPTISGDAKRTIDIIQNDQKIFELQVKPNEPNIFDLDFDINPGENSIILKYNGEIVKVGQDTRDLAFSIVNFKYTSK